MADIFKSNLKEQYSKITWNI